MRRMAILTLVALLGCALCAPATGAPRFSPFEPDRAAGPGALRADRTATPTTVRSSNGLEDVRNLTTGLTFSTIQAAIDDAGTLAGHVLEVQVASHAEGLCTVTKAVTIQGGGGGAIITSTTDTGTAGDARGWFLVTVAGVTFQDLAFDGGANLIAQALRFTEAGTVRRCAFRHIARTPAEYTGVAVVGYENLTVADCSFTDIGRIGVFLFGPDVTAGVVSGCSYAGKGQGDWLDYGIELGGGAVVTLTNNTVTGCVADESGWSSGGMLITTYYGPGTSATLTGNVVNGNSYGVAVGYDGADVAAVTVHGNDLSGNTDLALYTVSDTRMVDASANWWGTNSPTGVSGLLYGTVDYTPWLHDAGDVDPVAPGFQGDFSALDVDDDSPQTAGVTRVNEAIGLVSGSTIHVAAGLYDERLTINKPVTLLGATSGVSKRGFTVPPAYAYDAATQSIIRPSTDLDRAVVHVAADGVVFDGFVVANEVCAAGSVYRDLVAIDQNLAATTGVQILNCVLGPNTNTASQDGNKGRCGVTVYGPHTRPVKLIVMHNLIFDSKGNGAGIMIVGPYGPTYHGGTVHENYFAGSVIEDNDILGNHRTGIEFAGGVQGGAAWGDHILIRGNLIAGNGWFSLADKDALKYGHGIMFIRAGSDRALSDAAGSRYVRLENNVIGDNEKSGLYVGPRTRDLFGTGNVIRDNGKGTGGYGLWDGVRVDLDELYYAPGTTWTDHGSLANVSFVAGGIHGNGALGVDVMQTPTAGPVDVTCNWWGDVLGPDLPPANPSPGDGLEGAATYAPWWTTASGPCDGYGPNHVAAVPPGTCVTPVATCVQVPVVFDRVDPTPVRGYSVTLTLSSNLALCGAGIAEGSYLSSVGSTSFGPVLSLGGGVYTVDCAILGGSAGATGPGTLFTLDLAGAVTGTGTVTVNSVTVRDVDNAPVAGIPGPPASITIDNDLPGAVTLSAAQKRIGNDGDGTTKIDLAWSGTVTPGDSVLIYRAGWGNYPEYDDVGGGVPAVPAYPPGAPWEPAGKVVGASSYADETTARDFWYYVAFVKDPCGNVSVVSNRTGGTLNYHLGDVAAGCAGDNRVTGLDVSFLGANYGQTLGYPDARACLDVGPTTNYSVNARPTTDNRINFEDLMMFAINHGQVSGPQDAPLMATAASDEVWLDGPARVTAGATFTVSLRMKGAGDLQGLSAQLGWDPAVAEPVSVEAGGLATAQNGVVLSGVPGNVDVVRLGAGRGLAGEGVLATVTFQALAAGAPAVTLAKLDARSLGNQPVELAGTQPSSPATTRFAPAMPNPFDRVTTLSYALAKGGVVSLAIYSVDGRKVATLASGVQEAGTYRLTWDGEGARPGMYYARLTTPEGRFTRTLVLTR